MAVFIGFSADLKQYNINKDMIGFELFKQINSRICKIESLSSILDRYEETYNLRRYKISQISPYQAQKMYENIEKKFYKYYAHSENSMWFENELRLFVWLLVCYLEASKKNVRLLNHQDWEFFSQVFYVKQLVLFKYQAKILLDYSLCLQRWNHEQDQMLKKIVSGVIKIKWSQIAKSLFVQSEGRFVRTSKQCRERWLNHLDPSKSKQQWTHQECIGLLKSVLDKGKKWANLVQELKGKRSQHSIKNKFNSMMIKQTKLNPHHSEHQKCKAALRQMQQQLKNLKLEEGIILAFPFVSEILQKQNQEQFENENQMSLQKSNASLAQTLNLNSKSEGDRKQQMELNIEDFWLDLRENKTCQKEVEKKQHSVGKGKRTREEKERRKSEEEIQKFDLKMQESDSESLIFLEELKLMIRESELDR